MPAEPGNAPAAPPSRLPLILAVALALLFAAGWLLGLGPGPSGRPGAAAAVFFSLLGLAADLALLGLILAGALGAGLLLLRLGRCSPEAPADRALFAVAVGLGLVSYGTLALGLLGFIGFPVHAGLLLVWVLAGGREILRLGRDARKAMAAPHEPWGASEHLMLAFAVAVVLLMFLAAHSPVVDYDSLEYHIAAPAHHLRAGRITFWAENVYANFPQHVETLYLLGMILGGGPEAGLAVALLVQATFGVLAALTLARLACVFLGRRAALPAAAFLFACPFFVSTVSRAYITLAVCLYAALAFYAFLRHALRPEPGGSIRWAVLAGLCAGLGVATKYTAVAFVCAPLGVGILAAGLLRKRATRTTLIAAALFGAVALAAVLPWFVKNTVYTGNPVYPLAGAVFDTRHWSPEQNAKWSRAHHAGAPSPSRAVRQLWRLLTSGPPGPATGPWEGEFVAGVAVLFIPFLLLLLHARSRAPDPAPAAPALALTAAFFGLYFVLWFLLTHRIDRFLAPAVFCLVLLGATGFTLARRALPRLAPVLAGLALTHALLFQLIFAAQAGALTVPLGAETREQFFDRVGFDTQFRAFQAVNQAVPESGRVLFVGEAQTYYIRRPCLAPVVFNRHPLAPILETARSDPDRALAETRRLGFTHLLVNWPELRRLSNSYRFEFEGRTIRGYLPAVDPETGRPLLDLLVRMPRLYPGPGRPGQAPIELYRIP
jgi:hypothetical protein